MTVNVVYRLTQAVKYEQEQLRRQRIMSEQQVVTTTATPANAQDLLAQIRQHLPNFASAAQSPLEVVFTTYSAYVMSPVKIPLVNAMKQLAVIRKWKADDVSSALEEVMGAIAAELEAIAVEFEQITATQVDETDFETFELRFEEERKEQYALIESANQLITLVGELSALFGISNPDPGLKLPPAEELVTQPTSVFGRFGLSMNVFVSVEKPKAVQSDGPIPDWVTEPVLNMEADDILLIQTIQDQRQFLSDPLQLLNWLTNLGTSKDALKIVLERVANMAREQIAQSQQILEVARQDYGQFQTRLGVLQDVRAVVLATHDYFFPVEAKPAPKAK